MSHELGSRIPSASFLSCLAVPTFPARDTTSSRLPPPLISASPSKTYFLHEKHLSATPRPPLSPFGVRIALSGGVGVSPSFFFFHTRRNYESTQAPFRWQNCLWSPPPYPSEAPKDGPLWPTGYRPLLLLLLDLLVYLRYRGDSPKSMRPSFVFHPSSVPRFGPHPDPGRAPSSLYSQK